MRIHLFLSALLASAALAAPPDSPIGLWKTVDDKTGQPRGLVRIYEQDGALCGRIESSLRKHGAEFSGGEIPDPDTGSTYRCRLTLEDKGARLIVRGYIGLPLAGRSQTWYRAETQ